MEALPVLTVNSKRTEARLITAKYCFSHRISLWVLDLDGMCDARAQNELYLFNGALNKVLGEPEGSASMRFHGSSILWNCLEALGSARSGLSFHRSAWVVQNRARARSLNSAGCPVSSHPPRIFTFVPQCPPWSSTTPASMEALPYPISYLQPRKSYRILLGKQGGVGAN